MPLSKAKQAEFQKERRKRLKLSCVIPSIESVIPKYPQGVLYPDGRIRLPDMTCVIPKSNLNAQPSVIPKTVSPSFLFAEPHFGVVKNRYYANCFFNSLLQS